MTRFEKSDGPLDAVEIDEMMRIARSLRHFVKKVEKNDFFDARSDMLLFEGTFIAVPVLLAFAMELALKALLYRGGHTKLERTHDLGCLYEKLSKESRDRIEEKTPIPYPRELAEALGYDMFPDCMPVGKLLEYHKDAFVEWRYLYENRNNGKHRDRSFHRGALDRVLNSIISVYDENYGR